MDRGGVALAEGEEDVAEHAQEVEPFLGGAQLAQDFAPEGEGMEIGRELPPVELKHSTKKETVEKNNEPKKQSEIYTKIKNTQKNTPVKFYDMVFEGTTFDDKILEIMNNIADYMKENKNAVILITGYALNGSNDEKIIREATQRATAIRNYLIKLGIPDVNIKRDPSAIIADSGKGIKPYIEIKFLEK